MDQNGSELARDHLLVTPMTLSNLLCPTSGPTSEEVRQDVH